MRNSNREEQRWLAAKIFGRAIGALLVLCGSFVLFDRSNNTEPFPWINGALVVIDMFIILCLGCWAVGDYTSEREDVDA